MPAQRITPTTELIVDLADLRAWCRADTTDEDTLIAASARAMQGLIERETDHPIPSGSFLQYLGPGAETFEIPNPPLVTVDSIQDANGAELEGWTIDQSGLLPCVTLPDNAAVIRWTSGYDAIPEEIKHALRELTALALDNPTGMSAARLDQLPMAARWIIDSIRLRRCV